MIECKKKLHTNFFMATAEIDNTMIQLGGKYVFSLGSVGGCRNKHLKVLYFAISNRDFVPFTFAEYLRMI